MDRAILLVLCVALCAAQSPTPAQSDPGLAAFLGRRLAPADQAAGHPDLVRFRSRLTAAIVRHDLKYLLSVAEPGVAGCGWDGVDGFRAFVTDPGGWAAIQRALQLGGVMSSPQLFRSNYVLVNFPFEADRTSYLVAVKPNATVYEKPDVGSVVISKLHYEIVIPVGKGTDWQKIEYRPGKLGYVRTRDLGDPTGYSLGL